MKWMQDISLKLFGKIQKNNAFTIQIKFYHKNCKITRLYQI